MNKNKKHEVIEELFKKCKDLPYFDNDLVKDISKKVGFGNHFDATKIDTKSKLPSLLVENDYALIHLGDGKHKFIKDISNVYHTFEEVTETVHWQYKKSLLNSYNSSESNILSVANNQRILHDFLFEKDAEHDIAFVSRSAKTYFPHRTKVDNLTYHIKKEKIELKNLQIEIDLTIEFEGTVAIFEAKNGKPDDFAIYQLYHPFLYYQKANITLNETIKRVVCVYLVREKVQDKDALKLWAYDFEDPLDMTSIRLFKSRAYLLVSE